MHIIWTSPLPILGTPGVVLNFYLNFIFKEILLCKQNSPRLDAKFCGVTPGALMFANVIQKQHLSILTFIAVKWDVKYQINQPKKGSMGKNDTL